MRIQLPIDKITEEQVPVRVVTRESLHPAQAKARSNTEERSGPEEANCLEASADLSSSVRGRRGICAESREHGHRKLFPRTRRCQETRPEAGDRSDFQRHHFKQDTVAAALFQDPVPEMETSGTSAGIQGAPRAQASPVHHHSIFS